MKEIRTEEDAKKFVSGEYDTDLLKYLIKNSLERQLQFFVEEDYVHISQCLKSLIADLFDLHPAGDLIPILENNLFQAVGACDETNVLALNLYVTFLYNKVPGELLRERRRSNG